VGFYNPNGELL